MLFKKLFIWVLISIASLVLIAQPATAEEGQKQEYRLLIKVAPNIIAMPGNQLMEVPIEYARIRSTELRTLNKTYNATKIEKY